MYVNMYVVRSVGPEPASTQNFQYSYISCPTHFQHSKFSGKQYHSHNSNPCALSHVMVVDESFPLLLFEDYWTWALGQ